MLAAFQEIGLLGIKANGNLFGNLQAFSLFYCIKHIKVAAVFQESPHLTVGLEGFFVVLACGIHQIGNDGIAPDIFGDVFLGVVGSHLGAVVDILLKDIAQHIGIDVAARSRHSVVEVPVPFVEEVEETAESLVGYVKSGIVLLYLVNIEHTAIQIRDAPIDGFKRLVLVGCVQSVVEQADEESLVELFEEAVFALVLLCPLQLMTQVIDITIEETFLLNEVAEHEAVEHNAGVPLLVLVVLVGQVVVNACNELGEVGVLFLEACIEVFGDFLGVDEESRLHLLDDVKDGRRFVVEREREAFHFLKQEAGLVGCVVFHQHQVAFLHFLDRGYPEMVHCAMNDEDADIVLGVLAEFGVQFLADGRDRNLVNLALQYLETATLGYLLYLEGSLINGIFGQQGCTRGIIPSHLGDEQFTEITL